MDKREALHVAQDVAARFRIEPHALLVERLLDSPEVMEVVGASGTRYQVEVEAFWDAGKPGNLRVIVSIEDGGLGAFVPQTTDFIMAPDGSPVGE